jgi:hypothetical protein
MKEHIWIHEAHRTTPLAASGGVDRRLDAALAARADTGRPCPDVGICSATDRPTALFDRGGPRRGSVTPGLPAWHFREPP